MTPLCSSCGAPLTYWRALDRVPHGHGAVKDARHHVCTACRRVYRVTVTVWRDGHADQQPTAAEWRRLDTQPTAATGAGDAAPVLDLAGAAQLLGPLVDLDRLRLARRVADWWNTTDGPRSASAAVEALPGFTWRTAGRAVDDAAALALIDLADRPPVKRPRPPGSGRTEPATDGIHVCDVCGHDARTARGLGSHRLTHRHTDCVCGWAGTAAEHRAHIRWHCPDRNQAS